MKEVYSHWYNLKDREKTQKLNEEINGCLYNLLNLDKIKAIGITRHGLCVNIIYSTEDTTQLKAFNRDSGKEIDLDAKKE